MVHNISTTSTSNNSVTYNSKILIKQKVNCVVISADIKKNTKFFNIWSFPVSQTHSLAITYL